MDVRCREVLESLVPALADALRPHGLRALLLGGSAALGEAVGWAGPDPARFMLSDLDLTAITRDVVPLPAANRIQAWLLEQAPTRPGPSVTLGLVPIAHCPFTPPTPGMVDLVHSARLLLGEERSWRALPRIQPHRIPRWEALRLTGNRALELLRATLNRHEHPGDRNLEIHELHALAKAATGLFTSSLILDGTYQTGWRARAGLLWGTNPSGPAEVVRLARSWDSFLRAPSMETQPSGQGQEAYRLALGLFLAEADRPFEAAFPVRGFLEEPCDRRDLVRAWRRGRRAWARVNGRAGANGWICRTLARALSEGLAPGTPAGRALAAATLYWVYRPDQGLRDDETAGWLRSSETLLGVPIPPGADVAGRLEATIRPLLFGTR